MNTTGIPESYLPGLQILEKFTPEEMRAWLLKEVREESHTLSGGADDQPVQAILNHARYLTPKAKGLLADAIQSSISTHNWESELVPDKNSIVNLLHFAGELPVPGVKAYLKELLQKTRRPPIAPWMRHRILCGPLAFLSDETDTLFWHYVVARYRDSVGTAFQVLLRISPKDAIILLGTRIPNKSLSGSVCRALGTYLVPLKKK